MDTQELWLALHGQRPLAAQLARLACLPVRVAPALLRLARLRLLPQGGTGDEADLWLSDLVESRSGAGFVFRRPVREHLRASLAQQPALLDAIWLRVHAEHAAWLAPRARLEVELSWRLLRNPADPEIETRWAGVVQELDTAANASGVARWVLRAIADLPAGTLDHASGRRAWFGAHLLLGDASVLGSAPQDFIDSAAFAFATRQLKRRRIYLGLDGAGLVISPVNEIAHGHAVDIPATTPLWLQLEHPNTTPALDSQVLLLAADDPTPQRWNLPAHGATLRSIDGAVYRLALLPRTAPPSTPEPVPRVQLSYEVELNGSVQRIEPPFVIGVVANFLGRTDQSPEQHRKFVDIDAGNFDATLAAMDVQLALDIAQRFGPDKSLSVRLQFRGLVDFAPDRIAAQMPSLKELFSERAHELGDHSPADEAPNAFVFGIDGQISDEIDKIMHHPQFQRLEATWRGLHHLVTRSPAGGPLKIRILNYDHWGLSESADDFGVDNWEQSPLFKQIYEAEFSQFGGQPFGLLLGDYDFGGSAGNANVLSFFAKVAAASHAPFVASASPFLMNELSWHNLADSDGSRRIFDTYWSNLRASEDARFIGLTMPRFLARTPYPLGSTVHRIPTFWYREEVAQANPERYTWISAAYAMAANIARSYHRYGWCADIRGIEGGGLVDGLPTHTVSREDGTIIRTGPTEISITDRREAELSALGLMPLVLLRNSDNAAFFSARSVAQPPEYSNAGADASAELATHWEYLLPCCQLVRVLMCLVRDKVGSFRDTEHMQSYLNAWLAQWVMNDPASSNEAEKALRPFAVAQIQLSEPEGRPGYFDADIFLQPHYRLAPMDAPIRLHTRLPGINFE